MKSLFLTFSLLVASSLSFAQGQDKGNGGDARCAEYSDLAGSIASTLLAIGQDKVNKANPIIHVDTMLEITQKLKCFPVNSLDRQARSYPDMHTDLFVSAWDTMSSSQKVRLTSHELAVMANYEQDGEYTVSNAIFSLIEDSNPVTASAANRVSGTGDIFTRDTSIPALGEAYKDPSGLIWGDIVMLNGDAHLMQHPLAEKYCQDGGTRLPTEEEFDQLTKYLGKGTVSGYSRYQIDGKTEVLPHLGLTIWLATVYESVTYPSGKAYAYFDGITGGYWNYVDGADDIYQGVYAFRCVSR